MNLPSRSLKEYFSVITNPLSLKGLQKLIKGIHGRNPPTGVSEFKGWAALEERAALLWDNAHYFNEEGSDIYNLATELKVSFSQGSPRLHGSGLELTNCRNSSRLSSVKRKPPCRSLRNPKSNCECRRLKRLRHQPVPRKSRYTLAVPAETRQHRRRLEVAHPQPAHRPNPL